MIIILSPSKTIDFSVEIKTNEFSIPKFKSEVIAIIKELKKFSPNELESLMKINPYLAELNFFRIQKFSDDFLENSKQAIYAYKGEVYRGLNPSSFYASDLDFANKSIRILSGLYGILRPLDLIKEHRLEISTNLKIKTCNNLYEFWKDKITKFILSELKEDNDKILVNLASKEYTDAISMNLVKEKYTIITPIFKDYKNGKYKNITIYSKHSRGLMASYIVKNKIESLSDIKEFDLDDYKYADHLSKEYEPVFIRDQNTLQS
ncbi:MAG: peroxide stress protein YaaA [Oscillospiraceae bacterium]|nr:peroxide stress protein YaaA [Oscillospiraceae bacterium]